MKSGFAAAAVFAVISLPAFAADPPQVIVDDEAIAMATSLWDGVYAGVSANYLVGGGFAYASARGIVGVNMTLEQFVVGAEGFISYESELPIPNANTFWVLGGEVRGGFLATETVLVYGSLGAEVDITNSLTFATTGVGVEVMVADNVSLDFDYHYVHELGGGGFTGHQVGAGVFWHFD